MTDCTPVLQKIKKAYAHILGDNLAGIYIHGSMALGSFDWNESDIDFIAVVHEPLTMAVKAALMESVFEINKTAPPRGIEMSVVLKKHCLNFVYPTPFELHFSNGHIDWYTSNPLHYCENMNGEDSDLAAHFTIIKKAGIVLCGEKISNIFGDVPKADYIDSIKLDIKDAREMISEHPRYNVLTLCRVLAYLNNDLILSKTKSGQWGLENLDKRYHDIIRTALNESNFNAQMSIEQETANDFCDYILNQIFF